MKNTQDATEIPTLDGPATGTQDPTLAVPRIRTPSPNPPTDVHDAPLQPTVELSTFQPNNPGLQEFTVFPNLPLELRRMIWGYSLPGPRVIEIFAEDIDSTRPGNERITIRKDTHTSIFAVLQVCKESEEVVSRAYEKITARAWNLALPSTAVILIDYDKDIIHSAGYPRYLFFQTLPYGALEKITTLGLGALEFSTDLYTAQRFRSELLDYYLPQMTNLRTIVLEDDDPYWEDWVDRFHDKRDPAPWGSAPFLFDGIEERESTPALAYAIKSVEETAKIPSYEYLKGIEFAVAPYTRQSRQVRQLYTSQE